MTAELDEMGGGGDGEIEAGQRTFTENMYGNSQFDGNAAFSGGGFMPSQTTQTADPSFSPAKNRDAQALLPLTVKQISEAFQSSDDKANFLIDGVDVNNVKLVGMLHEKTERVTDVSFVLDDGTGRIDCHRWYALGYISIIFMWIRMLTILVIVEVRNGMYVKVHGHLKGFQGKKQLMVYSVRPLTDYNEIANHFADCIYVHCYNTKIRKQQDASQVPGHMPNSSVNTPSKGYQSTQSNHFSVQYNIEGVKGIDKMVLNYLQQPSCIAREKGVHRSELAQQLNVTENKILEAIDSLESEGLIYSTIDEFHYKSTANG
ncbi:replication protein a 32 kDa subunit b [Phtheirospermum japonicum]|uniref:Replication protein a 32 kDa subunit b n=1 Tax=Phtheirospermum japonicum TaxID=374723 RepID=A0A830CQ35_9LAMI|nr:replication protein a 32 kDa subunit b [Phtheirospermum japonicum]